MDLKCADKRDERKKRNISTRINRDEYELLDERAHTEGLTLSKAVRMAISRYLQTHEERSQIYQLSRQLTQVSVTSQETYELLKGLVEALSEISDSGDFK